MSQVATSGGVLGRLEAVCNEQGLPALASRFDDLAGLVGADLADVERVLGELPRTHELVVRSATHLLDLPGKRLRPTCAALAARLGGPGGPPRVRHDAIRAIGVAIELVHNATLLHDDVVDLGDQRRGALAARVLYGNAASVFAGDWLLVEALRRVLGAGIEGALERLFGVLDEMILAESIQLEHRGRIVADRRTYLRVADGKTASLFGWAMWAGGHAGGLGDDSCDSLERYGRALGLAFQVADDVIDLVGDARVTGKSPLADLVDGKVSLPIAIALERAPELAERIEAVLGTEQADARALGHVLESIAATGAIEAATTFAEERAAQAVVSLASFASSPARAALETIAVSAASRRR